MNERQRKKRFARDNARRIALIDKKYSVIDGIAGVGLTDAEERELERLQETIGTLLPKRARRGENIGMDRLNRRKRHFRELVAMREELEALIRERRESK